MTGVQTCALPISTDGRLVQIGLQLGHIAEKVNWTPVMVRRLTLTGSTLRPRSLAQKSAIAAELRTKIWPLLDAGRVKPMIHATFPLAEAAAAHALMESSAHLGKIALVTGRGT